MRSVVEVNQQYERIDTHIITGTDLPVASQNKNYEIIDKNLFNEVGVTVELNYILIAHRIERKLTNAPDVKKGINFVVTSQRPITSNFQRL